MWDSSGHTSYLKFEAWHRQGSDYKQKAHKVHCLAFREKMWKKQQTLKMYSLCERRKTSGQPGKDSFLMGKHWPSPVQLVESCYMRTENGPPELATWWSVMGDPDENHVRGLVGLKSHCTSLRQCEKIEIEHTVYTALFILYLIGHKNNCSLKF